MAGSGGRGCGGMGSKLCDRGAAIILVGLRGALRPGSWRSWGELELSKAVIALAGSSVVPGPLRPEGRRESYFVELLCNRLHQSRAAASDRRGSAPMDGSEGVQTSKPSGSWCSAQHAPSPRFYPNRPGAAAAPKCIACVSGGWAAGALVLIRPARPRVGRPGALALFSQQEEREGRPPPPVLAVLRSERRPWPWGKIGRRATVGQRQAA